MHAIAVEHADIGLNHNAPSALGVEWAATHMPALTTIVEPLTVRHRRWPAPGIRVGFTDDGVEAPDDIGERLGMLSLTHRAMIAPRANQPARNRAVRGKSGKRRTLMCGRQRVASTAVG